MGRKHRTAPQWVRDLEDREVHAIALRLLRESQSHDLSRSQDWLLDRLIDDLGWRWTQAYPVWRRCSCWLCTPDDWLS